MYEAQEGAMMAQKYTSLEVELTTIRPDMKPMIIAVMLTALFGCMNTDVNDRPTYGDSGLPKNCRAIIAVNIEGWRSKQYTAEEVLGAIDRNCGASGYSWGQ